MKQAKEQVVDLVGPAGRAWSVATLISDRQSSLTCIHVANKARGCVLRSRQQALRLKDG